MIWFKRRSGFIYFCNNLVRVKYSRVDRASQARTVGKDFSDWRIGKDFIWMS